MKRFLAILLAIVMVAALAAGCGAKKTDDGNGKKPEQTNKPESALKLMEAVWDKFAEDEKFSAMGGDMEALVDGAPGSVPVSNTDFLTYTLLVPAEQINNVDDAASLVHGMMANSFTGGAFHVTGDASVFADAMREAMIHNQWLCGTPENLAVTIVGGEYVVAVFGYKELVDVFQNHLAEVYADADVRHAEAIAEDF